MKQKEITIKSIKHREREYLAYFKSEFLQATFCITFKDTIFGAVALNRFAEMIKDAFDIKNIPLSIGEDKIRFESKALLDTLKGGSDYDIRRSSQKVG